MTNGSTLPDTFFPFIGLVWLAVLVTMGSRSIVAALIAGVASFVMPGIFSTYLPTNLGDVPTILFGLGAVGLATHPEGVVAQTGDNILKLVGLMRRRTHRVPPDKQTGPESPAATVSGPAATTAGRRA
jgi:branched-chain amino acid transport system permease protein